MTPSPYQEKIFDFVANGTGNAVVNAVAGSGKTTTICQAARLLRPGGHYKFLAFNASIADELKGKLPYFVNASTFHSSCFAAYKAAFPKVRRPTADKTKWIMKDEELVPERDFWPMFQYVSKLVSFAKANGEHPDHPELAALIDHHDLDDPPEGALAVTQKVLQLSLADTSRVDFDDMLWMTYLLDLPFSPLADFIFVDEAQDLSGVQHELLERMLKPGGRLIAVGDKHQAIYGFRGAHTNGMDSLRERFCATELPLSISYRCSKAVVAEAQRVLTSPPRPRSGNPEFSTSAFDEDKDYLPEFP